MQLNFSKADLLSQVIITPGWYVVEVLHEEMKLRENVLDLHVNFGFKDNPEMEGREIQHVFWKVADKKAFGFFLPFVAALQGKSLEELAASVQASGLAFEFGEGQNLKKKVRVLVNTEVFEGKARNKIQNFLPMSAEPLPL